MDTCISFTDKDSWAQTQVPDLIVKVAMLLRGQVAQIKVKTFIARMGPWDIEQMTLGEQAQECWTPDDPNPQDEKEAPFSLLEKSGLPGLETTEKLYLRQAPPEMILGFLKIMNHYLLS